MIKHIKAILLVLVIISFVFNKALSQPGKMSNITYFEKYIKHCEDRSSAINNIHNLRLQLSDTLFIDQNSQDTTWLKKHREAAYVNFLCFLYESKFTGGNTCLLLLGIKNYTIFYKYRGLSQFPQSGQYESEYAELTYLLKSICIKEYQNSAFNAELIPESACGCKETIKKLKNVQDEELLAAEKAEKYKIQIEITQRQILIQDSLKRLKDKIIQEPVYLTNGVLRADSTYKVKSKNLDTLNTLLVHHMIRASNKVFSHYVNNCSSENVEIMLDILAGKKFNPCYWLIKLKKVDGILTLVDDIPLNGIENKMLLKLISELYLAETSGFVEENELLVLPFKIYRNSTCTDNKTVEYKIENGFIHVVLPLIILNPNEFVPPITPEDHENSEFERKRTRE